MLGLEYIRNIYGLTIQELADRLDVSKQTISKWEKGDKKIPQVRKIKMTEDLFIGIPLNYYDKELNRVEQLEVQKNKIKTESDDKIIGYTRDSELNFEDPTIVRPRPIYESDVLNLEIEKEKIIQKIRELLNDVTPDERFMLQRYKAFTEVIADYRTKGLGGLLEDVKNLDDEDLSKRASWFLSFLKL